MLSEEMAIDRENLGDVHYRVSEKTGGAGRQKDIAWGASNRHVTGDDRDYDGLNVAAVEGVCLDYQDGTAEPGLRATRLWQIRPPNLAALKLHHRGLPGVLVK
jgi:hypothetical protein